MGALIVDQNNVHVSSGYNGTEPGLSGCLEGSCPRGLLDYATQAPGGDYSNCIGIHAEDNALRFALSAGQYRRLFGSTCYVTRRPCVRCAQLLSSCNVARAVWPGGAIVLRSDTVSA